MQKLIKKLVLMTAPAIVLASCSKDPDPYEDPVKTINKTVVSSAGDSAAIVPKLEEFRVLAGNPLNAAPGATEGRREVNWDGVPAAFTNNNNFPLDFFGSSDPVLPNGRKRGLIMKGTTTFRVDSTDFSEIDPSYESQFESFSRKRLFTYIGNTVSQVAFKVPGTETDAFVKGFGVIFSDVDDANLTTVEYFNGTKSLGVFKPPPAPQGFSFLGVHFPDEKVTLIKITSGNGLLATGVKDISSGGTKDLVVMDDFIYSEPRPVQ
jgi:hypothetical protein